MKNPYELAADILEKNKEAGADSFTSINLYGDSVREHDGEDGICSRFHLENESGTGNITMYHVFPGMELVYNDMHMAYCNKAQEPAQGVMEINYCREGRSECLFGEHKYCYMSAGDLSFCSLQKNAHQSEFPTSHYHGITVIIDFGMVTDKMRSVLTLLNVDWEHIKELSQRGDFTIIRANPTIEHIFSELYTVPDRIRQGYIRVKVLELLLVLTGLDMSKEQPEDQYFPGNQITAVKKVHGFLVAHYSEHYTIEYLAQQFEISPTVLKKCFKGVYGDSIYAYMKQYRLQIAEKLLLESRLTVAEIAGKIGYLNPNKFTSAFCAQYGMPPSAYRRKSLNR